MAREPMTKEDRAQLRAVRLRAKELSGEGLSSGAALRKAVEEEIAETERALEGVNEQARTDPPAREPKRRLKR